MIDSAFKLLEDQLDTYIKSMKRPDEPMGEADVMIGNIAAVDAPAEAGTNLNNKIILSLVNVEEEAALKNGKSYHRTLNNSFNYVNQPVFLNLYMLATAFYDDYGTALTRLSDVIRFFQGKNDFSIRNSPTQAAASQAIDEDIQLYLDLFSMSFEQLNHLWGSLGGKQWPSVLYKIRLVRITENRITTVGEVITDIRSTGKPIVQ
jgi:hypothetical protein